MRMLEFCHVTCIVQSQRQNEYYYMYVGKLVYNFSLAYLRMFWNVLECSGIFSNDLEYLRNPLENFIFLLYFVIFLLYYTRSKPGAGLGWMEPRMESFLGLMDRRRTLRGYIGGVKIRESQFAEK